MPNRIKDLGEKETDKLLDELEKKIAKEYSTALKEVQNKYEKFAEKFADQEAKQKKLLDDGKITVDDFKKWKQAKLQPSKQYQDLINTLSADLAKVDQKVMSIANGYMPDAYALNFNYSTYEIETNTSANTSFNLYSRETVERLIKQDEINLPKRKVDIPLDQQWNKQHLNSAITQGILQGKSIPDIAKNLQQVTDMGRRAAVRNARTMMTGAQNSGRIDAYERASDLGIKIQKEWMATLDTRTRDSHAEMDGERVDWDDKFSNKLMYPGDPSGPPEEVYNCRCTLVPYYPKYANNINKRVTYSEWASDKKTIEEKLSESGDTKARNPERIIFNSKEKKEYDRQINDLYIEMGKVSDKEGFELAKSFYGKYQEGEADENTFFTRTMAEFKEVLEKPNREPDYISNSGSKYWYSKKGVIREADHWGDSISTCSWALKGEKKEYYGDSWFNATGDRYGFAKWDEFVKMPQMITINENEFVLTTFENNSSSEILNYKNNKYLIFNNKAIKR